MRLGLLLFVLLPVAALAQGSLRSATDRLAADGQLAHGVLGVLVVELESGEVLASENPSRSLVPASLLKVTTTATALEVLGPDHRFETTLAHTGTLGEDGVLRGDLLIVGGGDPSLGAGRPAGVPDLAQLLDRWTGAARAAGIRRIEGDVIGEESLDPGAEPSPFWQWNDIGNYYGAGAGALVINENKYELQLRRTPRPGGSPEIVGYAPSPGALRWRNEVTSGPSGSGDRSYIYGAPGTLDRVIRGTIPAGSGVFRVKGSLPDPAANAAAWLREALTQAGIEVTGEARGAQLPGIARAATAIDTLYSPPLAGLVELTNFRSVNLFAEALYAALGRAWGVADDPARIGDRLEAYWAERGLDAEGWDQVDGSGLGMRNLITPMQLASVLRLARDGGLPATLPRVGVEGTVRSVLRGRAAAARIRAKSGTLKRSRGFCGYAELSDGREVAFVVIANNFSGSGRALRGKLATWLGVLVE